MDPKVKHLTEENDVMSFTMSNVNVSIANALRRIILSEIPCVVFKTTPYAENKVNIEINTTRLNNELLKQRISCVPIHISDTGAPIENYTIEINKLNDSDVIDYVTTGDIKIKDSTTDKYLSEAAVKEIFPPDQLTNDYIDIARLRPKISSDSPGEQLKLTAKLEIGTAKQDGCFNVASACAYAGTPDTEKIADELSSLEKVLKDKGETKDNIEFEKKDWMLLKGQTFTKKDSFDFKIETVGQFTNMDLLYRACHVMLKKLEKFKSDISSNHELIINSENTIPNCFDIKLINEGYTLGKAIEYVLYAKHYDRQSSDSDKRLTFCGFRKPHPHIDESIIRIGFKQPTEKSILIELLVSAASKLEVIFNNIANDFQQTE